MIEIYYYHSLHLTFKSAQTIQIIRDYLYLSKQGYRINLYGFYIKNIELEEILEYIKDSNINILYRKKTSLTKITLKIEFLKNIILNKEKKILVTRTWKKGLFLLKANKLFKNHKVIQEFHEEAFPHLIKENNSLKSKFLSYVKKLDAVIFTNFSQEYLFKKEFDFLPNTFEVLPNGVEIERFKNANKSSNYVVTYLGQFNKWKNVELIFEALSLLDKKFSLKIAGGKGDNASKKFISDLSTKYNIEKERVNYLGFVKNSEVVKKVLDESNVLLLPLGDNIQSKYLTSPMKLFEYMATKIPIVAVDFPSVNMLVDDKTVFLSKCNAKDFSNKITLATTMDVSLIVDKMNEVAQEYSYNSRSEKFDLFIKSYLK